MQIYNESTEEVKRFELMENGNSECYFDVESIENIFDFYAENDQIDKAERVLKFGCKLHPDSIPLLLKKTFILIEKDEDEKAIKILEELLKFENSNIDLYYYLGWAYFKIDNDKKALSYFKKALNLVYEDEKEDLTLDIAFALNHIKQYFYAIDMLEEACIKYPENEDILFELAYAYDKVDMTEESFSIYCKLLKKDPFSENAWNNIGILHFKNNRFKKALKCYNFALAIDSSNAEAWFNKGNALVNLNEFEKALDCYIEYVSYGYEDPMAYQYIADCLDEMGLYNLSMRFYELTVIIEPDNLMAWLNYISLLIEQKEVKKALEKTAEALLTSGLFPEFIYLRAKAYILSNNYESALHLFAKCVEIEPENVRNIAEWFQVKKEICPNQNPMSFLDEWYKRFPANPALKYASAAIAIHENKDFKMAAYYLEEALLKAPESFEDFVDYFLIPDEYVFENEILNPIIEKYIEFEK